MKKSICRVICVFFCLVVLCACLPASAFAVDPVSAGIMADAFAQAIAAYGASNGVAMTFDVSNTNGIGESVHELWSRFRAGTQDADDYETLAAALFPDLYYKASVALGTAAEVYTVGYNISAEYVEEFDNFYNWLLTGPAEMVKVDNQYFQFSQAQVGSGAVPINVVTVSVLDGQPMDVYPITYGMWISSSGYHWNIGSNSSSDTYKHYYFLVPNSTYYKVVIVADHQGETFRILRDSLQTATPSTSSQYLSTPLYYKSVTYTGNDWKESASSVLAPVFSTVDDGLAAVYSMYINDPLPGLVDSVGVKAYSPTGVASFPDTADPNYEAVAKRIPSDIPWDDTAYGDGTGTLTDAQAGTIAADASEVLAEDGVLTLADTATPGPGDDDDDDDQPSDDPDDYLAVGLEDIFPFCIPFDIYNFLSALAAEPVAPHFTATLAFPQAVGGTQTIEIDFDSPTWNQLAQLLRLLELLAFIVGLALLTRSMFIRG